MNALLRKYDALSHRERAAFQEAFVLVLGMGSALAMCAINFLWGPL